MGLQYFEALSPGIISSIIAVLVNRMVVGNDVTGYFRYPFLNSSLPSSIFTCAIFYGLYGLVVGVLYAKGAKICKNAVHDWFHVPHSEENDVIDNDDAAVSTVPTSTDLSIDRGSAESMPLISHKSKKKRKHREKPSLMKCLKMYFCLVIRDEPKRAAAAGAVAGALVGIIAILLPHTLFWGEAQLQNLINRGTSPLPIFSKKGEVTEAMTAYAFCLQDEDSIKEGFSMGCSALIAIAKTVVIGLSLGTGIIGGHFWGPLYVGCAASHLLIGVVEWLNASYGFPLGLVTHPCVVILCTMGAAHVGK